MRRGPKLRNFNTGLKTFDTRKVRPPPKVAEDFYGTEQWKTVRAAVLKRDGYKCVRAHCGRTEGRLYADHIVERKDGGADFDMGNLETLCASCHKLKTNEASRQRGGESFGAT